MKKIFGSWSNYDEIKPSWIDTGGAPLLNFPTEEELLFASYGGGSYEGDAHVVFERNGRLYEAHGSHCSCYGLEGQWAPEETTWAALAMPARGGNYPYLYDHDAEAVSAYWQLVDEHNGVVQEVTDVTRD